MNRFEIVKIYIDEYDYYGLLADGAPNDEFDNYSQKIASIISEKHTAKDIALLIAETMDVAFNEEINWEKFLETAHKIRATLYEGY